MLFNPATFLTHIKALVCGGGMKVAGTDSPRNDAGFLRDANCSLADLSTDSGAVALTDSTGGAVSTTLAVITAPAANATTSLTADMTAVKNALASLSAQVNLLTTQVNLTASETNLRVLSAAASTTAVGTLTFVIPRDYDENTDAFFLKLIAASAGSTNSPALTATIYRKRPGAAIATVGTFTGSQALTSAAAAVTFTVIGKLLLRDDVLTIVITSAAHTTDAVLVYGVEPAYRSTLVSFHESDGSRDGKNGNFLR